MEQVKASFWGLFKTNFCGLFVNYFCLQNKVDVYSRKEVGKGYRTFRVKEMVYFMCSINDIIRLLLSKYQI